MADFLFGPTPHEEAAKFIADKPVVSREVFNGLLPELRGRAFLITGIEQANVVQGIRDRIAELPAGANWDAVKKDIANDMHPFLADPSDPGNRIAAERKAELLLRTHGFQTYQAFACEVQERQKDVFPYYQYHSMGDDHVRPTHKALDGIVLPANHEFWKTHTGPWEWGCRCLRTALSQDDKDEIEQADKKKNPDNQRVLNQHRQDELTRSRRFERNGVVYNMTAPSEEGKPGAYKWHPGDLRIPVEELRKRYDVQTWGNFEAWARGSAIPEQKLTVWEWLSGSKLVPAGGSATLPPPPMVAAHELHAKFAALEQRYAKRIAMATQKSKTINWNDPKQVARANKSMTLKHRLMMRQRAEAHKLLTIPKSEATTIKPNNRPKALAQSLDKAFEFLGNVVSKDALDGKGVDILTTASRAHADLHGAFINGKRMGADVVVHEMGHIIEQRQPALLAKSLHFRGTRTIGETPRWLGHPYQRSEISLFDEWAKLGGDNYTGKVYRNYTGKDFASEILSMGLQRLFSNPVEFWKNDPAFFDFTINLIRGKTP